MVDAEPGSRQPTRQRGFLASTDVLYRRSRNTAHLPQRKCAPGVTLRERLSSGVPWVSDERRPLLLWATFIREEQ
jgi:hypothetical protein